jgi:hypothetical protein
MVEGELCRETMALLLGVDRQANLSGVSRAHGLEIAGQPLQQRHWRQVE